MPLLSHAISFSPEAGFKSDGTVVVVATGSVVVATTTGIVVVAELADFVPHAARPMRKGRSRSAFFTLSFCQRILISRRSIGRTHDLGEVLVVRQRRGHADQVN